MQNFLGAFSLPEVSYHRPQDVSEAVGLLEAHPDRSLIIAGCTDVIPEVRRGKLKLAPQTQLIDLKGIDRLQRIAIENGKVTIGAAASYAAIMNSPLIAEACPMLAAVAADIGSAQVRSTGTIGGNLATASPGGDASVGLLALGSEVVIAGADGEQVVPLTDFFTAYAKTVLTPQQIVVAVRFAPMAIDERAAWIKHGRRKAFTMSVLSVALRFKVTDGVFHSVALAMGLAGPTPRRLTPVEEFLQDRETSPAVIREAAAMAEAEVQPRSSFRASAEYRRDLARVLTQRAFRIALASNK